jgi:hypothetical protein
MKIIIKHQSEGTYHNFFVKDPAQLTELEVSHICVKMGVSALFVNGKYYQYQ